MKNMFLSLGLILSIWTSPSFAHDPDGRVSLELDSTTFQAGAVLLTFQLVDIQTKTLLKDTDLAISNEKKLHFIVYDKALEEFRHEHPVYVTDHWEVTVQLPRNGDYFTFAQGQLAADGYEFSPYSELSVSGGLSANPVPTSFTEVRKAGSLGTNVTFPSQKIQAEKEVMVNITFSRTDGTPVQLSPYLGAMAHVIGTPTDGDSLIHVHPMSTSNPNVLMLHATFPEVGYYRLWIQFIDGGILKVAPLMIEVVK